jgi:uncharacterized Zn finger protein
MANCTCGKLDEERCKHYCYTKSGLPQDRLKVLADRLEATEDPYYLHDIKLARVLAEALDKPRRDASIAPILLTAEYLIEYMLRHLK